MSFGNYKSNWPVCHRCERTERKRQGRHNDVTPVHWVWVSVLFGLFVLGGAISDLLTYLGV